MDQDPIPVELDPVAAQKLREAIKQEPGAKGIRVGIEGGGCSGYTYTMGYLKEDPTEADFVSEQWEVKLVVDVFSAQHLEGTVIEYSDSLIGGGFKFINPNHRTCGCGESFNQKEEL